MMNTQQQYNKIQQFIQQNYQEFNNSGELVVQQIESGFKVGNFTIVSLENGWQIQNQSGAVLYELHQRRLAILLAALLSKKKYEQAQVAAGIDRKYDIFYSDSRLYEHKLLFNPDNCIYADRLTRAKNELETLSKQISELEKTACLQ